MSLPALDNEIGASKQFIGQQKQTSCLLIPIYSCQANENANDGGNNPNGCFTAALLKALDDNNKQPLINKVLPDTADKLKVILNQLSDHAQQARVGGDHSQAPIPQTIMLGPYSVPDSNAWKKLLNEHVKDNPMLQNAANQPLYLTP